MIGKRYSRLVCVQSEGGGRASFRCDCGTTFTADKSNVVAGRTRSCGCLRRYLVGTGLYSHPKHGHAGRETREYRTWNAMVQRCTNPRAPNFSDYGGRGISVCARWRESFALFLDDMGARPIGTSLDRIDGTKGYEPGNCRWATPRQQMENRRTSRMVTIAGETRCATEWARRAGVSDTCMLGRIKRGLTGAALLRPSQRGKSLLVGIGA